MAKAASQSKASSREAFVTAPADDDVIDGGAAPGVQASGVDSPETPVNVEGAQNGGAPSPDLAAAIAAAGGGVTTGTSSSSDFDGGAAPQ